MPVVSVNYGAVLVAALICMVLGALWYSPVLFAKAWMQEVGKKMQELKSPAQGYVVSAIAALVLAYIMAHFVAYAGASTISDGMVTGFWAWLGFSATGGIVQTIFQGKSLRLFAIDYGYYLVEFLIIGALLAVWR